MTAAESANPLLVEVTRGDMVESRHRAAFAVSDSQGRIVLSGGDFEKPVYGRSAIKPLQALPLLETGAAEAYGLGDSEIALACASHNGEPRHLQVVLSWLKDIGCSVADLECGPQLPGEEKALFDLIRSGNEPTAAHNNCSGKHTGFLTVARFLNHPTKDYIRYEHPVQQRILGVLETMTGLDLGQVTRGIDGCGIPVLAMPLGNIALAMARLADPGDQPDARQAACARVRQAMAAKPFLVAGNGRFCTKVMEATGGRALVKTGAEGVFCGSLPQQGLGIALNVDDGATRAAEALMGRLLQRLDVLDAAATEKLSAELQPQICNRAGRNVGEIRPPAESPF